MRVVGYLVHTLIVCAIAAGATQQGQIGGQVTGLPQPPRDAPTPRAGTGVISGVVTAADTGLPLRQAVVMLMMQGVSGPSSTRATATDIAGRFEFAGVPAGSHALRADPGPFRGQIREYVLRCRIRLDGQAGGADCRAAIRAGTHRAGSRRRRRGAGHRDFGDPVTRVRVSAARVMGGGSSVSRIGPGAETDDQGRFRVYGIPPGEYIVAAESRDAGRMPVTEGASEGFATTFFPSALTDRDATRVRIAAGQEVRELQIQLVRARLSRITGRVLDSGGRLVRQPGLTLVRPGGFIPETSGTGGWEGAGSGPSACATGSSRRPTCCPGAIT